eukprot:snap_masked-scaffold3765_size7559-processed-gene-0.1 protein:Tk09790 transcript:snap_masked-scaffold3765_size7559-processed-gene-0.1-mRNA-1 annotation:"hypothetical protein EUTSA_v10006896mg"
MPPKKDLSNDVSRLAEELAKTRHLVNLAREEDLRAADERARVADERASALADQIQRLMDMMASQHANAATTFSAASATVESIVDIRCQVDLNDKNQPTRVILDSLAEYLKSTEHEAKDNLEFYKRTQHQGKSIT